MKFETRLTAPVVLLAGLSVLFPFAADWHIPLLDGVVVAWIENGQALWLLFGAVFTAWYIRPLSRPEGEKQFWLWAVLWWVILLGRSTSWGRVYFPQTPHVVFKIISAILISTLLLSLFSRTLRSEIKRRVKEQPIPLWLLAVTVITFLISDTVEHHRLLAPLFVRDVHYAEMMEELYETPFMVGLLLITHYFMHADKEAEMALTVAYQ